MKTLVLGGSGFLGKHLTNALNDHEVISMGSECDLMHRDNVENCIHEHKPDLIYHLAAYVGGIGLNRSNPGDMFYKNIQMGINVIDAFRYYNKIHPNAKLVVVGTVCMYPKFAKTPFTEDDLWSGYPEETNAPYGVAKKSLMVMADAYRKQYNSNIVFAIPSNLYGPEDNFDHKSSHVIPAIIRKVYEAKESNQPVVTLWGTGNPTREFLYVKDCAQALKFLGENYNGAKPINIAVNNDISIKDLADIIVDIVGYDGRIEWDTTMPDGQPIRCVSNKRLIEAGFNHNMTDLRHGMEETYEWFRNNTRSNNSTGIGSRN